MGRKIGSRNKPRTIEAVEQSVQAVNVPAKEPETEKISFMDRYNRPLPFIMRPFCFGANYERK